MTDHVLASQLAALLRVVESAPENSPEAGMVHLVTGTDDADAIPTIDFPENARPSEIACVGYRNPWPSVGWPGLRESVHGLRGRDLLTGDHVSFLYDPKILVGVALAVSKLNDSTTSWLVGQLEDPRYRPATPAAELWRRYALHLLRQTAILMLPGEIAPELAPLVLWLVDRAAAVGVTNLEDIRAGGLRHALTCDPRTTSPVDAALAGYVLREAADLTVENLLHDRGVVLRVLERFEPAMRRWRWDPDSLRNPVRWPVPGEREVQDILYVMLRSSFDDVIDEQTLPKTGHASFRADFALPRARTLIEVKFVRAAGDFRDVEKEVMEDSVGYFADQSKYDDLVVFIYDDSRSVEHHQQTKDALMAVRNISGVVIVSRPGVLAEGARKRLTQSPAPP